MSALLAVAVMCAGGLPSSGATVWPHTSLLEEMDILLHARGFSLAQGSGHSSVTTKAYLGKTWVISGHTLLPIPFSQHGINPTVAVEYIGLLYIWGRGGWGDPFCYRMEGTSALILLRGPGVTLLKNKWKMLEGKK